MLLAVVLPDNRRAARARDGPILLAQVVINDERVLAVKPRPELAAFSRSIARNTNHRTLHVLAEVTGVGYACVNSPVARTRMMLHPSSPPTSPSAAPRLTAHTRPSRHLRPSTVLNSRRHAGPRSPRGHATRACATWPSPTTSPTKRSVRSSSASPRPRRRRSPRRLDWTAATTRSLGGPAPAIADSPDPHCGASSTPGAIPSRASARAFSSWAYRFSAANGRTGRYWGALHP